MPSNLIIHINKLKLEKRLLDGGRFYFDSKVLK